MILAKLNVYDLDIIGPFFLYQLDSTEVFICLFEFRLLQMLLFLGLLFLYSFSSSKLFCFGHPPAFQVAQWQKNPPVNAGDVGLISGSERSSRGGNDNPLQYSCPKNPMDKGAWQAAVRGVERVGRE